MRAPAGAFYEYGYFQFGVPSFSTPGWGLPGGGRPAGPGGAAGPSGEAPARPAGVPAGMAGMTGAFGQRGAGRGGGAGGGMGADGDAAEGIDLRLLQWMDSEKVDGFVAWAPFKHPTLGDVEIGGFKPYVTVNPPAAKIAELGAAHAKFVVHADVAVRQSRHREDRGDGPRRRALPHQGRRRECRIPARRRWRRA